MGELVVVYFQTQTACDGHCSYCPHDDIYENNHQMSFLTFKKAVAWLIARNYGGRLSFLLHYEPTLDKRLLKWIRYAKERLPNSKIEIATNGKHSKAEVLKLADFLYSTPAGSLKRVTARAGNCRNITEISQDLVLSYPCDLPFQTLPINYKGEVILCCQDWRHEVVCGTVDDLDKARERQLELGEKARKLDLEICRDCYACRTAEGVGERLGKRRP